MKTLCKPQRAAYFSESKYEINMNNTYKYEISNCQHLLGHLKKGKRIHEKHLLLFH